MNNYGYDYYMMQQQMLQQEQMQQQMQDQMVLAAQMQYQNQMQTQQAQRMRKTTKKDILEYLQMRSGAREVVQVDEFETQRTRHICQGSKKIVVLEKGTEPVQTSEGFIFAEYFLCNNCKKLIINKQSIEMGVR